MPATGVERPGNDPFRCILHALAYILLLSTVVAMEPRRSPETLRVRLLYIGVLEEWYLPYRYLGADPFFEVHTVPAHINLYKWDDLKKWTRMYMPRTYKRLIEEYDVFTLFGVNPLVFSEKIYIWLRDAVLQDGLGSKIFGLGTYHFAHWMDFTCLRDIFPIEMTDPEVVSKWSELRILKPENPLIASLPFSSIKHGFFFDFSRIKSKVGSEVLAELVPLSGSPNPELVWWDIGEGRSIASSALVGTRQYGCPICEWKFLPDFLGNVHLYAAGLECRPIRSSSMRFASP